MMLSPVVCVRPQVVASAIVDKYIGESARVVREMFGYAKVGDPTLPSVLITKTRNKN